MAQGSVTWPRIKFQICQIQLSFLLSWPFAFFPTSHGEPASRWVIRKGLKFLASQLEYRLSSYHHPRGWIGWENHRAGLGGIKRELKRHLLSHILPSVPSSANPWQVHEASLTSCCCCSHLELLMRSIVQCVCTYVFNGPIPPVSGSLLRIWH